MGVSYGVSANPIPGTPMKRLLTDTKVKNLKPDPGGRPYKMADGGGMFVLVKPSGARLWRFKYRLGGKEHLYALGVYPEVSLAAARQEHEKAYGLVKQGHHPRQARDLLRLQKLHAGADTLKGIANEWIEKRTTSWTKYYRCQVQRAMDNDVLPSLGALPVRDITPAHILAVLKSVEARGAEVVAENIRRWLSQVFRYAIVNLRADIDPAASLKGVITRPKIKHNVSLTPHQITELIKRLDTAGGNRTTRIAIELLLLTMVRTGELRKATWAEFDLENSTVWRVPAERMKRRVEHLVPLSTQAVALLSELRGITGSSKWLFPNYRRPDDCMSATTINRALERMGFNGAGTVGFAAHGFRGTASTLLHEQGFNSEAIERQLAHAEGDAVKASYNKAKYLNDRAAMLQAWGDQIDGFRLAANGNSAD